MPTTRTRRAHTSASVVAPGDYVTKGDSTDPQAILDVIALGKKAIPQLDTYWWLYQKHPWVACCVNIIAAAVSEDGFDIVARDGKVDPNKVASDPRTADLGEFWDQCFVGKITYRRAMYSLGVDLKVFGLGYWRKRRAGSIMLGLERVDPRCVLPKPNADRTEIDVYLIRKPDKDGDPTVISGATAWSDAEKVNPKDMVFFTLGGGDQLFGAPSPLEHLDYTIGLDLAIRRFRQSFFNNGAQNGKIIGMKGATREQVRDLENKIRTSKRGPENAFKTWIFASGEDIVIEDKGNASGEQDVDFVKGSQINREEVMAVYHVPPGKLLFSGNALGSSGKAEDDQTFQEQSVLPLEEAIFEIINRDILVAEFGIDDLEMAPKRRAALRFDMFGAANEGVQIGMTGNESRALVNLPPITDPKYDMDAPLFLQARGQGISGDEPLADQPAPTDDSGESGNIDDANDKIESDRKKKSQKGGLVLTPRAFADKSEARVLKHESKLEKKLNQARKDWVATFWSQSGLHEARKAEPLYYDEQQLPITPDEAAQLKKVIQNLGGGAYATALYDELSVMVSAGWISAAELLNITAEFGTVPAFALDAIRQKADQFAFMVTEREQKTLFDAVDSALAEGQTPKELAGVIGDLFSEGYHVQTDDGVVKKFATSAWSKMVARTELNRAQTLGAMSLYQSAGIESVMWVTNSTPCDECADLEGEVFAIGDAEQPPLHPNCNCSLVPADEDVKYQEAA